MIPTPIRTDFTTPSTSLKPVTAVSPVTAILDSQNFPTDFIEGQKYLALIEARLLNGNSRVMVNDKLLQMKLPDNFQPGDKLELVFITRKPEPQFLVLNQPHLNTTENSASISSTGRLLGFLMQDTVKQAPGSVNPHSTTSGNSIGSNSDHTAPRLISTQPVSSSPTINSAELPSLLQKAITQSGLFYESHQAQWIQGENTLENLQQEPQGKLIPIAPPDASSAKATVTASMNPEMPVHTQAIPIVQQQLNTLETGNLFWRGEIWQGQTMDWNIHEEPVHDEKDSSGGAEHATQWRTQIRLSLPQLGEINAMIALNAQGADIRLSAARPETANLLKGNRIPLATDMQAAGIIVRIFEIQHDANK